MVAIALDIGAAVFSFIAAVFWFLSASRRLPTPVIAALGTAVSPNDPFIRALRFSASMNRRAALFAGLAAGCMAVKLGLPWLAAACSLIP